MSDNVRVAVRVRPFRELHRKAQLIIGMTGNSTTITDPAAVSPGTDSSTHTKSFTFDYSYWSHDEFVDNDGYLAPASTEYADQERVFEDLGNGVLDNAWEGYNCSLFAYGQTGSGKSYSMVGYGVNKGIIPVTCERLFQGIQQRKNQETEFQVILSMLEIYNEQVRDLLNPASLKGGGLKIRENPQKGFYVDQLSSVAVKNYKDIEERMAEGTKNRTIASTNMNATSSRAHTIVAITFIQKSKNKTGQHMTKSSAINLVDLAGSERAESTGAMGTRLKEGAAINKSLSTLGNVIKALADISAGKKALVPFRDSALTKLLKNALGGNSKTIMIAALSPADINYDETLSTLRFADRAKSIKTKAVINESATDKMIRELREENAKLLAQLMKGNQNITMDTTGASQEEIEKVRVKMQSELSHTVEANKRELEELQKTWEEKLSESQQANQEKDKLEEQNRKKTKTTPHFWNLNEDPQLTGMVVHLVKEGVHRIGNQKAMPPADIVINGLSIQGEHATLENEGDEIVTLTPGEKARILVNGEQITFKITLHHNDRILLGSSNLYVFYHPKELTDLAKAGKKPAPITYDSAQEEVAANFGFDMTTEGKTNDDILLREDLLTLLPMLHEANAMSEELNKKVIFEIVLVSPQVRGLKEGRTEVKIKMRHLVTDHIWIWSRNKFLDRKDHMQDMYQNYVEGEEWQLPQERDPFWEPPDLDVQIGAVHVYLQSLSYNIELQEELAITDFKGDPQGHLSVEILPCKLNGTLPTKDEDLFVDDPDMLIGKPICFMLEIKNARDIPQKFTKGVHCRFQFYLDTASTYTNDVSNSTKPTFLFSHHFSVNPVTNQFLDYLKNKALIIEVDATASSQLLSTKELVSIETARRGSTVSYNQPFAKDEMQYQLTCELSAAKKHKERLEKKIKKMKELVEQANKENRNTISVEEINKIMNTDPPNLKAIATVVALSNKAKGYKKVTPAEHAGPVQSVACTVM